MFDWSAFRPSLPIPRDFEKHQAALEKNQKLLEENQQLVADSANILEENKRLSKENALLSNRMDLQVLEVMDRLGFEATKNEMDLTIPEAERREYLEGWKWSKTMKLLKKLEQLEQQQRDLNPETPAVQQYFNM